MANTADIKAVITAEDRASSTLKKFGDNVGDVGSSVSKIGSQIAHAFEIAGTAAVGFATLSIKAYSEAQAQAAQVNQVLQTTGKVSQISSKQVLDLAMSMERYSGQTHTAIEAGQVLLLQFAQTTKQNLPEMTKAMVDLAQRMGVDDVTAAKSLGIALDDPTTGMNRLRRSGIDFTAAQKETIKSLQATGDITGADAVLMQALEEKVGGAAGAFRGTFAGSVAELRAQFKDLEESVGKLLVDAIEPYVAQIANYVQTHGPQIQAMMMTFMQTVQHLTVFLKDHGKTILEVFAAYKTLKIVGELATLFSALGKSIGIATLAFKASEVGALASRGAMLASLASLGPYGLAIGAVAAAGFGLYKIYEHLHKNFQDNLKDLQAATGANALMGGSVSALTLFTNALNDAQNRAKDSTAQITALQQQAIPVGQAIKVATQNVADAQTAVNNALATYGRNSPQYVGAVAALKSAQDDLNNKTNTGINNALNLILQKGRLRDANNQAAQASANLAGWQDIVNGKLGSGIFLAGQLTAAILGIAPAISSLQGSIAVLQRNVGAAVQSVGSLQFQAQSGFSLQGARASGGPVSAGGAYLVGENGPEIIVPNKSGTVIPNDKTPTSGNQTPINVSFSGIFTGSEQEFRKLAIKVFQAGADAASMQNLDVSAMTTQHWRRI